MEYDQVINADCIEWANAVKEPFADLVFADPPFNIGFQYDVYEDRKAYDEYYQWTEDWMGACTGLLKPAGAFWVAIGAEYAAEVRLIGRKLGLWLRNWVIWHYTFGQNTKAKFARAHVHLFYFTKDSTDFVFNADAVGVLSDRQKEYADKRANPKGKVPFDVWQEFPRVCGTFGERKGWHPCQMPESLLGRIIRACSNVGEVVFDPFAGSGTTLVSARKLGRRYMGTEISPQYVAGIRDRLAQLGPDDVACRKKRPTWPTVHIEELSTLYVENGTSPEKFQKLPHLWAAFVQQFNARMANLGFQDTYSPPAVWRQLQTLGRGAKLGRIKTHAPGVFRGDDRCPGESAKLKPRGAVGRPRKAPATADPSPAGGLFDDPAR